MEQIYDAHKSLKIVISGSSLIKLNDGDTDLSRRMVPYHIQGLSFREFLLMEKGIAIDSISLDNLLESPNSFCAAVKKKCHPLEFFMDYLKNGFYPFYFENRNAYPIQVENVIDYIINVELTQQRGLEVGNTRKMKALLKVISNLVPYEIDVKKLSKSIGIERGTFLKYLKFLEEAKLIIRLFQNLDRIGDLQKPDKILLDNTNLMCIMADSSPVIGTLRECFFCNQLISAGHKVEYGGIKTGDFRIDDSRIIEVGVADKDVSQMYGQPDAYVAVDGIDSGFGRKIPLWAFGILY